LSGGLLCSWWQSCRKWRDFIKSSIILA